MERLGRCVAPELCSVIALYWRPLPVGQWCGKLWLLPGMKMFAETAGMNSAYELAQSHF